jgi:hypothetical protein
MDETEGRAKASGLIDDLRVRHDGWTAARQRAFLRALSETGCVRDACARARISNTSAYRMRQRSEAFARAWDRAIDKVMPTIEQAAYERAVLGWEEPIIQGGKVVGARRRYSDSLLRLLLQRGAAAPAEQPGRPRDQAALIAEAHRAARAAGGIFETAATEEETNRALERKLDAVARRLAQEEADERQAARPTSGSLPRCSY